MENRVENPGLNIDRGRVDSFKKVIKEKEVFKLEGSDRDLAAIGVIGELGINGVNTTEDLFNKTQNGNVNQEVARKNIKDLGTAIAESILESDNEELKAAMVAGSYSTEALLPEPWRGRMESDAGDVGLAGVICDALTEKISDKAKKETVQRAMETVDFFKNNSEYNNLLPDQLDASITELRGLINPLNRNEMKVISERLKYLQDEKEKTSSDKATEKISLAAEKMAKAAEKQSEATEKFVINYEALTGSSLDNKVIADMGLDDEDDADMVNSLSKDSKNPALAKELGNKQIRDQLKDYAVRSKERKLPEGGVEALYKMIDFIESGSSSVDDLSRNSEYYRVLYQAQNGIFDEQLKGTEYNGKKLEKEDVDLFKEEIGMRMFLHGFYLAASKCKSIEDIMRVVGTMHEGDINKDLERDFVSFFLKKDGVGLNKLPVDKAWDLRQKGYFEIDALKAEIESNNEIFSNYLRNNKPDLYNQLQNGSIVGVVKLDPEITADKRYGIPEDIYKNYFSIQKNNDIQAKVIKEYMVWKMVSERNCSEKDALKAYDLAQRFSVSTFSDSKANLSFSSDDYSELILFKYLRYSDGPNRGTGRMGKSKAIGSAATIRHIDTLTCHWLDLSRSKSSINEGLRSVYSPLYSKDIDFSKITGGTDMAYHFGGVVSSQVLAVQEAFYDKISPKDVLGFNYLNKLFAKINKTTYDMCKAGIKPVYYENSNDGNNVYTGLLSENKLERGQAEARVAEKMRKIWLINLYELAGFDSSGWTSDDLDNLNKKLFYNPQLYDNKGNYGASFISPLEITDAIKRTRVAKRVFDNDAEIVRRKKKRVF